jgi:hypothetical protein
MLHTVLLLALLLYNRCSSTSIRSSSISFQTLYLPPFGDAQHRWAAPLDRRSLAWICTLQFHSALRHHHHHSPCPPCTPHQALLLSRWCTSFPRGFIILPFKLHIGSMRANLSIPTLLILPIKRNDIVIQFRPLARPKSFGNRRSTSSFFVRLMNCVFLGLSALMRWES